MRSSRVRSKRAQKRSTRLLTSTNGASDASSIPLAITGRSDAPSPERSSFCRNSCRGAGQNPHGAGLFQTGGRASASQLRMFLRWRRNAFRQFLRSAYRLTPTAYFHSHWYRVRICVPRKPIRLKIPMHTRNTIPDQFGLPLWPGCWLWRWWYSLISVRVEQRLIAGTLALHQIGLHLHLLVGKRTDLRL